jgi:hypothetical protein
VGTIGRSQIIRSYSQLFRTSTATADRGLADWSQVSAGPWLADTLKTLRAPDGTDFDPGAALRATLRPYQKAGVRWLHLLSALGLGACLADDMGLGKTIQVLSLPLAQRQMNAATQLLRFERGGRNPCPLGLSADSAGWKTPQPVGSHEFNCRFFFMLTDAITRRTF